MGRLGTIAAIGKDIGVTEDMAQMDFPTSLLCVATTHFGELAEEQQLEILRHRMRDQTALKTLLERGALHDLIDAKELNWPRHQQRRRKRIRQRSSGK